MFNGSRDWVSTFQKLSNLRLTISAAILYLVTTKSSEMVGNFSSVSLVILNEFSDQIWTKNIFSFHLFQVEKENVGAGNQSYSSSARLIYKDRAWVQAVLI